MTPPRAMRRTVYGISGKRGAAAGARGGFAGVLGVPGAVLRCVCGVLGTLELAVRVEKGVCGVCGVLNMRGVCGVGGVRGFAGKPNACTMVRASTPMFRGVPTCVIAGVPRCARHEDISLSPKLWSKEGRSMEGTANRPFSKEGASPERRKLSIEVRGTGEGVIARSWAAAETARMAVPRVTASCGFCLGWSCNSACKFGVLPRPGSRAGM